MQLLKFHATWCNPCKAMTEIMEEITFPYEVISVDIEENMDLALKYGVRSVPTLVLVNENGETVTSNVGLLDKKGITEKFITA
jgi:thioredoxin 1